MTATALIDQTASLATDPTRKRKRIRYPGGKYKVPLRSLDQLDQRTRAAMRAHALIDAIADDLGGNLTVTQRQLAQHAALLGAMIEDSAARWLKGETIDQANYAFLINAQRRVLAALDAD
jgi:hypothetical protein